MTSMTTMKKTPHWLHLYKTSSAERGVVIFSKAKNIRSFLSISVYFVLILHAFSLGIFVVNIDRS